MIDVERVFDHKLSSQSLNPALEGSAKRKSSIKGPPPIIWMLAALLLFCPLMVRAQELTATLSRHCH